MAENPTIEELKAPLLAAIGAADLALATMTELVANLRDRAGDAREDASSRVEVSRARLNKLQEELPVQFAELRERFTADELRKAAEGYVEAASGSESDPVARGEAVETLANY
jgi:heparin binding hemagglutinin HbhA